MQQQSLLKIKESLASSQQAEAQYKKQAMDAENNYRDAIEVEKSKSFNAGNKITRIE